MKKEVNPVVAVIVVVVLFAVIGGYFWRSSQSRVQPSFSLIGADGKRHMPSSSGGTQP